MHTKSVALSSALVLGLGAAVPLLASAQGAPVGALAVADVAAGDVGA